MAAHLISPYVARDEISLRDAALLLDQTGHPMSVRTLQRQCKARRIEVVQHGRAHYASWSDVLEVHAAWVDGRTA